MSTRASSGILRGSPSRTNEPGASGLAGIAIDALKSVSPLYVPSILGMPWTWLPPYAPYSEFRIADPWRLRRLVKFMWNVTLPSIPRRPPSFGPPGVNLLFWQPTVILQRPDQYGSYTSFPDEAWFFVNGVATNDAMAQVNAAYLSFLFHRPITLIQNSTCGLFVDLVECALGKGWQRTTEAAVKAFPAIYDALKSARQRVVVIAHSQGTIIMSVVLDLLKSVTRPAKRIRALYAEPEFVYPDGFEIRAGDFEPLSAGELAKLEIYCFANCSTRMRYYSFPANESPVPWIESFGNEHDLVARLGMLAPRGDKWRVQIDGPIYQAPGAWGHLLNEHYLHAIEREQKVRYVKGGQGGLAPYTLLNEQQFGHSPAPRLFGYLNGGVPPAIFHPF